jgi:hypothetical protein
VGLRAVWTGAENLAPHRDFVIFFVLSLNNFILSICYLKIIKMRGSNQMHVAEKPD